MASQATTTKKRSPAVRRKAKAAAAPVETPVAEVAPIVEVAPVLEVPPVLDVAPAAEAPPPVEVVPAEAPVPSTLWGFIDVLGPSRVAGWVWDTARPGERVTVVVEVEGAPVATITADTFRPDLEK